MAGIVVRKKSGKKELNWQAKIPVCEVNYE